MSLFKLKQNWNTKIIYFWLLLVKYSMLNSWYINIPPRVRIQSHVGVQINIGAYAAKSFTMLAMTRKYPYKYAFDKLRRGSALSY